MNDNWIMAWLRSPRRMWKIWVRNQCPDCNHYSLAWGQWNDGQLAGQPICCNPNCPDASPYETHRRRKA